MHTASLFNTSRRAQKRNAFLLAIALCLWMLAYASHVHVDGEQGNSHARITHCSVCFTLPAGAPPPSHLSVAAPTLQQCSTIEHPRVLAVSHPAPSSYLSRGPPAV